MARSRAARRRWPSWKTSRATPNAAPTASRLVTHADRGEDRRLQRDEQQQEPEREHDADDQRGLARRAPASRSWFSATAPPTSAPCGQRRRSRSIVAPTAGSDGSWTGHRLHHHGAVATRHRRHHPGDARVGARGGRHAPGVPRWGDDLQRRRGRRRRTPPGPARSATREPSPSGTTLIDGMPVRGRAPGCSGPRGRRPRRRRRPAGGATAAPPRRRTAASGARRSAPTAATAGPRAARASPARREAASASPPG